MIKKGSLVRRIDDSRLGHIDSGVLLRSYPPEGSLCVVVSSPREKDLRDQHPFFSNVINLKKAIDVMSENTLYKDCEIHAFIRV
jgi:hypothetical protein